MVGPPAVIEYVLGRLHEIGVTDIFGVPGDFAFPIQDAIVAHPDINWIGCCNELNAGYAADGYARVRGVGALSTTYGVGELGAISAVAGSYAEHLPVFHLTGMPSLAAQADRALVHHTLGDGEFGLFRKMADVVVGASSIISPANAVAETERLIAEALYNRRPVYMAFPSDIVNKPVLATSAPLAIPTSDARALAAAADAVLSALNMAANACALPGLLLDRLGISDSAVAFIEKTGLPFATMFADKSVIDEDHPNYIGMYDGHLMDESVREFVESADVVIAIGTMQTDFNTGAFTARLDPGRLIDIGLHRTKVGPAVFHDVEMADLLRELIARDLKPHAHNGMRPESLTAPPASQGDPITAEALYPRWEGFVRPGDIVLAETGTSSMGLAFSRLPRGARFHNQSLWGAIGWATPAALGAAVAAPDRRVVLITGEGSHQLTAQEIGQFHRLGLRPVIFVLNNNGYLIERLLCADPDIAYNDVAPWNYTELPHALGCDGWFTARVTNVGEFEAALTTAGDGERAAYIEVVTDADEAPPLAKKLHDSTKTLYHAG
ncbi:indole-3-pyruvate decarboxylase [Mycobacterium saskatchewanense]|uniref:Alpha-keto-acid decarboxylase n=1 Tax=Mycobacterium saskatchewanense TaxID=220927 RepID=A0AAJ3NQK1_9MYCO|nr:thiamine pyrophosphate-binding protein [Mycobacterium saskatchewanense]ORW71048.1 indole-3-pyruvate decarboxylase [Mycobacterium saskatchewanense]BBX66250.1 indole-3-pyruvate decarboxylase [Mycobacterium saskatchewanense]